MKIISEKMHAKFRGMHDFKNTEALLLSYENRDAYT